VWIRSSQLLLSSTGDLFSIRDPLSVSFTNRHRIAFPNAYWTFTTLETNWIILTSCYYFGVVELITEVRQMIDGKPMKYADVLHSVLCFLVYMIGLVFQLGHIPLIMLSFMEFSTWFYDFYLWCPRESKWKTFLGVLFACIFGYVRIYVYGGWYFHVVPQFAEFMAGLQPCNQDIFGIATWCLPMNAIAAVLLTVYYALNLYWFVLIVKKMWKAVS
jgi:hypothetical protein